MAERRRSWWGSHDPALQRSARWRSPSTAGLQHGGRLGRTTSMCPFESGRSVGRAPQASDMRPLGPLLPCSGRIAPTANLDCTMRVGERHRSPARQAIRSTRSRFQRSTSDMIGTIVGPMKGSGADVTGYFVEDHGMRPTRPRVTQAGRRNCDRFTTVTDDRCYWRIELQTSVQLQVR